MSQLTTRCIHPISAPDEIPQQVFVEDHSKIASRFCWVSFNTQSSIGNINRYLLHCRSFPMRRNSVLSGFSFSLFVYIHDWTAAKHESGPFSAAAELPDEKEIYTRQDGGQT